MRRRDAEPADDVLPVELATCYVEDWCPDADGPQVAGARDPLLMRMIVARQRHREALDAWCVERGLSRRDVSYPVGPVWRAPAPARDGMSRAPSGA